MKEKYLYLKEVMQQNLAMLALPPLSLFIQVVSRWDKTLADEELLFFRTKTKNFSVILLLDKNDPFLLYRPRGIKSWALKWLPVEGHTIPKCLKEEVFQMSCDKKRRKYLLGKIVELKAYW